MRRAAILLLLLVGMQLILPLGQPGSSASLLTFGFLILAAYTVGEIATATRLPRIVGYLGAGVLFGPSALDVVTRAAVAELAPVSALAIALIAFLAGAELQWSEIRERGVTILKITGTELALSFVAIFSLLYALRDVVPFLHGTDVQVVAFAVLFATVAIIHSPAVTMALLTETAARGPVARTTLGVVLVADVVVILLFSGALAFARAVAPAAGGEGGVSLGLLVWEIGGSVIVGIALGGAVALYLRFVQRELFLFALLVTFLGAEIARLAHVEALLTLLVAGFVSENVGGEHGAALRHAMERAAAPVFVVFFALAGASLAVAEVLALWPIVLPIILARALGIWGGSRLGARWAGAGPAEQRYVWLGLISQAGVAIGLATIAAQAYPERGDQLRTLFLAVMAINQIVGPVLFRQALVRSGEIPSATNERVEGEGSHPPAPVPTQ
jgi:Kef-type K+ transport system membrane component KefB